MMKSKPSRRKQHQRATRTNLLSLAVVVILVGVSYLFIEQFDIFEEDNSDPEESTAAKPENELPQKPEFEASSQLDISAIEQRIARELSAGTDIRSGDARQALQQVMRTPDDAGGLQLLRADATGDGRDEWLLVHGYRPATAQELLDAGYEHVIDGFEVITTKDKKSRDYASVLFVDTQSMRAQGEALLLDQIPAPYGYGFRTEPYDQPPYDAPAMLFVLAILDEDGQPASDDLTLYWKPGRSSFAATNAFGQPGTFEE